MCDFPESILTPLGLVAEHPGAFLSRLLIECRELARRKAGAHG